MIRTLIRCGWIVSMDEAIGDVRDGEILVEGDRILAVGRDLGADADRIVGGREMLAIPGLVNMHLHTFQAGFRGIGGEWTIGDYFSRFYAGLATRFEPEDNFLGTFLGALAQLDSGTTTLFDYAHNIRSLAQAEASVDALEESGIRAVFGHGDGILPPGTPGAPPSWRRPHPRDRVAALRRGRLASDDARVTMALGIAGPHWADWETSLHNVRLGRDFGLTVSSHVTKAHGEAVVPDGYDRLGALGLLGPDHNLVHCNFLSGPEVRRLVDLGCSITCTNIAELHAYGTGPATLKVVEAGGMPSLGGDVDPMTRSDMLREMQAALLFARSDALRRAAAGGAPLPAAVPIRSRDALRWATLGGARALRMEHRIGSLTPGKKADVVLLRGADLNLAPVHDPLLSVVEQAHPGNVDTVMVDGDLRKAGGRLVCEPGILRSRRAKWSDRARLLIGARSA